NRTFGAMDGAARDSRCFQSGFNWSNCRLPINGKTFSNLELLGFSQDGRGNMAFQHEFAEPEMRSEIARNPHRAKPRLSAPFSIVFGRAIIVLMAAPWLFVLWETALQSESA